MHHPKKLKASKIKGKVKEGDVRLIQRGSKRARFWWIYIKDNRVGRVYIEQLRGNNHTPPYMKKFACITMIVDKRWKGRHVGRWAYKKAVWKSELNTVYTIMRKSDRTNIAAAKAAGFRREFPEARRYFMVWRA